MRSTNSMLNFMVPYVYERRLPRERALKLGSQVGQRKAAQPASTRLVRREFILIYESITNADVDFLLLYPGLFGRKMFMSFGQIILTNRARALRCEKYIEVSVERVSLHLRC
jgi:hypothetical protein